MLTELASLPLGLNITVEGKSAQSVVKGFISGTERLTQRVSLVVFRSSSLESDPVSGETNRWYGVIDLTRGEQSNCS